MSNQVMTQSKADLLEKVITTNDLAGLSAVEKVTHIKNVCESLGLNPLTKPIQLIKFQGKEVMYITRDATDQLRKVNHVSITRVDTKIMDGIYIATAHAQTPDGRTDASTGALPIKGLVGDALCNAMMKAESKAKRRVTLSICGLGMPEESELDTMQGAKKVNHDMHQQAAANQKLLNQQIEETQDFSQLELDFIEYMAMISKAENEEQLKNVFTEIKKANFKAKPELLQRLIDAKDKRKSELVIASIDSQSANSYSTPETGEVA